MNISKERLEKIASLESLNLSDGTVIVVHAYSTVRSIENPQQRWQITTNDELKTAAAAPQCSRDKED